MRLIDADALLKQIDIDSVKIGPGQYGDEWRFMDTIYNAQTIDPIRHGEWLLIPTKEKDIYKCLCSECGKFGVLTTEANKPIMKYCPHCGAKMDGWKE